MNTLNQTPGPQLKERSQEDLLNLVLPTLGDISDIGLITSEVAIIFRWKGVRWKVNKDLLVCADSAGTWAHGVETQVMELLLRKVEETKKA